MDFAQKSKPLLDVIYAPLCPSCGKEVTSRRLCADCFVDFTPITGTRCHSCALPLPGQSDESVFCDFCLKDTPAWNAGAAVALYEGTARRIILSLKHADRLDLSAFMAQGMLENCRDFPTADLVIPVPLHWRRLLSRRYNQALELARPIAKQLNTTVLPDALQRQHYTEMQKHASRAERIATQANAIIVNPRHGKRLKGQSILLVDDVMTTGATLRACANACWQAQCRSVHCVVFARVATWQQNTIV